MESEEIYTNEEIVQVAEKVVKDVVTSGYSQLSVQNSKYCYSGVLPSDLMIAHWGKGPLAVFNFSSVSYNPQGRFAIDVEALTMVQKKIVIGIVGGAMTGVVDRLSTDRQDSIISSSYIPQSSNLDKIGFSPSELKELKERGDRDMILRAIDNLKSRNY